MRPVSSTYDAMAEELTDAELLDLTYKEYLNDHTLDSNLPPASAVPSFATSHAPDLVRSGLGTLDVLPLEVLHLILDQLDVSAIAMFRQANRQALDLVSSLPSYEAITRVAPNILRSYRAIQAERIVTCSQIYEQLCQPACQKCGDFGGYLYLLTCSRVCFLCVAEDPVYLPLRPRQACRKFGLGQRATDTLPTMLTRGGLYSPNEKKLKGGILLVDHDAARQAGIDLYGSATLMEEYVSGKEAERQREYEEKLRRVRTSDAGQGSIRRPAGEPFDGRSGNPARFASVNRIPWIDKATRQVEWGIHCRGCRRSRNRLSHCRQKYTLASFRSHLNQFGMVHNNKHLGV